MEDNDEVAEEQKILEAERFPNFNEPDVPVPSSTSSSESEFDDDDSEQLPINNALRNTMEDTSEHSSTVTECPSSATIPLASSTPISLSERPQCSKDNELEFKVERIDRRETRYNKNNSTKQSLANHGTSINLNGDKGISVDNSSDKEKRKLPVIVATNNVKKT